NRLLLSALIQGEDLSFEERSALRDQWTRMMVYFGANLKYESKGMENMDEPSRRIAKARGVKLERTWSTTFSPTKILTAREYFVPGDVTELVALCLVVTLAKIPKDESIIIKNACINTGRAGALTALKRMGALVETTSKRERYGDAFGDVEVKPLAGKRLQGRRFSEDLMASCMDEYPLLALAACYAEGETILRIPPEYKASSRENLEWLAMNLRKTGVEVGVYDDGLVIRGKEELDGGEFDAANIL
ncbi:MAG TPA: 3-phosphoshikimate 1-carboxyvinyltransferase, partial [Fibrobacteraceae bacterium]|nr:3-phosphoshikimate 1-carboxyvinyltransferase [Fibrobacteraceae bacterium]